MIQEQAEEVLEELNSVRPEQLKGEAKRLFEAIMKIADEREELKQKLKEVNKGINSLIQSRRKWKHRYYKMKDKNKDLQKSVEQIYDDYQDIGKIAFDYSDKIEEQDKMIDLMAETLNDHDIDEDICKQMGQKENCDEFIDKEKCKACIKQYFKNKAKEFKVVTKMCKK